MMLVGVISAKKHAQVFSNYLVSQEIPNQIQPYADQYEIWVVSEKDLGKAKELWKAFEKNPSDSLYKVKVKKTSRQSDKALKAHYRKVFKRPKGHVITLTLLLIALFCFVLLVSPFQRLIYNALSIHFVPSLPVLFSQPWRVFTPIFLNTGLLSFLFNAYWFYDFGCFVEEKQSRVFYILLLFLTMMVSTLVQWVFSSGFFGGLSPLTFAVFGFMWGSSVWNPWSGYYIRMEIVYLLFAWLLFSFFHWFGAGYDVGNVAGLLVGLFFVAYKKLTR